MKRKLFAKPNPYHIQKILGDSPSSLVCLAYREDDILKLKHPLVLKIFKNRDQPSLPTLQMESLLRTQHSPFLVKVLSLEWLEGQATLVLEYIKGVTLKQLLKTADLNKEENAYICHNIQCGLKELKQNKLCHGDLSLSNILLNIKGHVLLTDYGLANYSSQGCYATPPFHAPELDSSSSPSIYSDLFSLGVIEKVLKSPFKENDLFEMQNTHFISTHDPLLDPTACKRRFKDFSFSPETKIKLSAKIQEALLLQECLPPPYQPLSKSTQLNKLLALPASFQTFYYALLLVLKRSPRLFYSQKILLLKRIFLIKKETLHYFSLFQKTLTRGFVYIKTPYLKKSLGILLSALQQKAAKTWLYFKKEKFYGKWLFQNAASILQAANNSFTPSFCSVSLFCFLFSLLSINPFVSYGREDSSILTSRAYILVRTQNWVQIELPHFKAYSPLQFQLSPVSTAGRMVTLKWKTMNSNGIKRFHIKNGQTLLLQDKDFE